MTERLLTVAELAEYLQVKPRTIYQWVWRNRIPSLRAGSTVRFRRAEIDDWLARRNRKETRLAPAKKSR